MEIMGLDAALRRRLLVLPFQTTFLTQSEIDREKNKGNETSHCRVLNPGVEEELIGLADVFFWLLAKEHQRLVTEGLVIPEVIRCITEDYLNANNYCLKFVRDNLIRDPYAVTDPDRIYGSFKDWFRRVFPSRNIPNFEQFHAQLKSEGFIEDTDGNLIGVTVKYISEI